MRRAVLLVALVRTDARLVEAAVSVVPRSEVVLARSDTSEPRRRVGLALGLPGVPLGFPDRDLCLPFRALDLDLECLLDLEVLVRLLLLEATEA